MKYAMIKEKSEQFSVSVMCRLLGVSASGYYHWLTRKPSLREEENVKLAIKIKAIFDDEKSRPGAPRITKRLNAEGEPIGRHRVAKIMQQNGWLARAAKKFKATTNSNHRLPVALNLLEQDFSAQKPNEKWVSDITYGVPGAQGEYGYSNEPQVYLKYPVRAQGNMVH